MRPEIAYLARLLRATAATILLPSWPGVQGRRKADGSLMTPTDLAVQTYLAEQLARDFPEISLLGEEMTSAKQSDLLADISRPLWVLDPLDGTTNYAAGFPVFAISLALIEGGETMLGVILDPIRDECFGAVRGQGAWIDGQAIRPSAPSNRLKDCVAVVDLKRIARPQAQGLIQHRCFGSQRNLGAVALEWCWLAAGRFQLYLHGGQKLWDYAAGRLIAEEAGAAVYQPSANGVIPSPCLAPRLTAAAADAELLKDWLSCLGLGNWE
ncbi:inositol monophosphatase family protein [Caldichromatium japonicum]|uniref:Inositol monophosphatase family protein n=1 Tax=Caldichromatium japonicum TaxID=2699430 RepID=A0A6G7VC62_9GAMM|nr:inositol monophosphatase family protein [Caldichromatium japonicum]QIK37554.1 inositol monophosphatase family protein [Caldichromatium japonicum]